MDEKKREEIQTRIHERLLSAYRAARRADPAFVDNARMMHEGRLLYLWSGMDLDDPDKLQRVLMLSIGLRGDLSRSFDADVDDMYRATVRHYLDAVESLIEMISWAVDEMYDAHHPGDFDRR